MAARGLGARGALDVVAAAVFGTLTGDIDRRRLERAAAAAADGDAAHELITFVYAGHSDWDTPNYSADARCVKAACAQAGVQSRPFPALLRFAQPPAEKPPGEGKPGSNNWAVAGSTPAPAWR